MIEACRTATSAAHDHAGFMAHYQRLSMEVLYSVRGIPGIDCIVTTMTRGVSEIRQPYIATTSPTI
jgi:hypothetical protein